MDIDVFLTHYHFDHLQGLPFFRPLYDARNRFTFHGYAWEDQSVHDLLRQSFQPPWFPISIDDTPASKTYVNLDESMRIDVDDLTVSTARLNHPQGVTAYRVDHGAHALVIATDVERGDAGADGRLDDLANGVDVLIHDAQYRPAEYESDFRGWGHSTWRHAVEAARSAGVKRLVLVSHDPDRSDDELDDVTIEASAEFAAIEAAYEGLTIEL